VRFGWTDGQSVYAWALGLTIVAAKIDVSTSIVKRVVCGGLLLTLFWRLAG
jgi:hypothetical protein